jgi:glucose-1-phosphate cytidylyltransferase
MREVPIVILCGGKGIFIDESGKRKPKGLVRVSGVPILIHILRSYVRSGFERFILSAGIGYDEMKSLFSSQSSASDSVEITIENKTVLLSIVQTGDQSPTGKRILAAEPFLKNVQTFGVSYSDTLSTIPLSEVFRFHQSHGKIGTLVASRAPTRFRILGIRLGERQVRGFAKIPVIQNDFINGGFYFFNRGVFNSSYLGKSENTVLEEGVLEALASAGELMAYPYEGSWHYLDCERDLLLLEKIAGEIESPPARK